MGHCVAVRMARELYEMGISFDNCIPRRCVSVALEVALLATPTDAFLLKSPQHEKIVTSTYINDRRPSYGDPFFK